MDLWQRAIREYRRGGLSSVVTGGLRLCLETAEKGTIQGTEFEIPYYVKKETYERRKHMDQLVAKGIGPRISDARLAQHKTSDTVFILGSGDSINDITDRQWAHIDQHDSIGLNRWPIHDFVPTYYVFEHHLNPKQTQFNRKHWEMIDSVEADYRDIPVIIKDTSAIRDRLEPGDLPEWLRGELIVSADSSFPQVVSWDSPAEQNETLLRYLDYKGYFDEGNFRLLYRKRSSISYLLHLCTLLGYETIVLCGVDLTDSGYFFDTAEYKRNETPIPWRPFRRDEDTSDIDTHKVNDPELGELTLEKVLYSMDDIILKSRGISLYVESKRSKLHPTIPLYEYDN
jgi:hypothetical protein